MSQQRRITDDLAVLLAILPPKVVTTVHRSNQYDKLLEIIMDLGRQPIARYVDQEIVLSEQEITREDIDIVVQAIGTFDADNRAGLQRTLHRISAIRNRLGVVVGMTLRVGRAVYGTIDVIEDYIKSGKSILILGRPGVGKTTLLREAARILAETKRVIIVDTSNEIGGDGDVPHPAVGRARRMQVKVPTLQHEVMIEAVENHNPEVIVIDEIGRELEAHAARTIAERGVQLIGTAHGKTLENLLLNPTLSDLVGGIESVTLSDEEAKRRGTQKTVLERRAPPTFDMLIEIQTRYEFIIHQDVTEAVDKLLRGFPLTAEMRTCDEDGKVTINKAMPIISEIEHSAEVKGGPKIQGKTQPSAPKSKPIAQEVTHTVVESPHYPQEEALGERRPIHAKKIFPYGVARNRLLQASKRINVPAIIVRNIDEADALITLRSYYRDHQATIVEAERRGMPIYVLRSNTINQIEQFLAGLFNITPGDEPEEIEDLGIEYGQITKTAIMAVLNGEKYVDLPPANSIIRRYQHEMVKEADLVSHSIGKEPRRYVRVYRD
jgi:stage III sporulation protein SpoIIIAA